MAILGFETLHIICSISGEAKHSQGRRETNLIGGGGVFIESPEYAIFIKLPEFYWMR